MRATADRRPHAARALVVTLCLATAWACGGRGAPGAPTPGPSPIAAKRLLVVTYTAGFHHTSIPIAETTIRDIGAKSALFATEFCRTADEVKSRLTAEGLRGVDGVFFANTTGDLGIPDMAVFLDWL